jgi:hypothetical protein
MENKNPNPILIMQPGEAPVAPIEPTTWRLCKDDAELEKHGLPPYSTSPYRYLEDLSSAGPKTFIAATTDAPSNSHVQGLDRLKAGQQVREVFNAHAGLIRVLRFSPVSFEDYLQVLGGGPWQGISLATTRLHFPGIYAELQAWSASPQGLPFLLHGGAASSDRLNEVFFLKLCAVLETFKEVRSYVKAQQLPLLNLSPSSFNVSLPGPGAPFPSLWMAKCALIKPGQAHPLKIKSTEQKYFVRLGRVEPSPFLPEGLGAHSFGVGNVRLRNVVPEAGGIVLEGTLVAEDYLGLDSHDLLWFKLPVADERLEFYAHVYVSEAVGPREARFRTVPAQWPEAVVARLKASAGTTFAKSPYEIWPLLSSPCDMHSLGIIAIRALLANSQTNLPVLIDDVLSLARRLGKDPIEEEKIIPQLKSLFERDQALLDLVSPHALVERDCTPAQARSCIILELWLETVALLLRLFPGAGSHSFCKGFGDVPPLALEMVFNQPIQQLESIALRLRSTLVPTLSANEEIAAAVAEQLAAEKS